MQPPHSARARARARHPYAFALALACALSPRLTSAQTPFTVGTASAAPGTKAFGVLHVPAGVDSAYDIPVAVINGARRGPVLAVVSGAHGTEYASVVAVQDLIQRLDPAALTGTVVAIPLVNVASFQQIVPHVNPVDHKSMNGQYPGDPAGTQTQRASWVITHEVVERADHLIDLHGGDIDENLRPYSYWTVTGNAAQDSVARELALAFGLDHIIVSADRPKDPAVSRFLENTASTRGKPSLTAEAGRAGRVDAGDVEALTTGVLNVMGYLRMLERPVRFVAHPIWIERVVTLPSPATGVFHPLVERDARVTPGTRLGFITDYLGRPLGDALAPAAGIVLFIRAVPSLQAGQTIASIGVPKAP